MIKITFPLVKKLSFSVIPLLFIAFLIFFTTLTYAATPTATTDNTSSITRITATLNGSVSNAGGKQITQRGFQYGIDTNYDQTVKEYISGYDYNLSWGEEGVGNGQFAETRDIAIDSSGNIYVVDAYPWLENPTNNRIQKFDSSGNYISKFGQINCRFNGPINDGDFCAPTGIAIDSLDNVYVVDAGNDRIQKFDSSGIFISKWGSSGSGNGQFNSPNAVTVDSSGNIYVADTYNDRIQKFDSSGNFIAKWGTQGNEEGQFFIPYGISTDSIDNVYVADTYNDRIQKFDSSGNFIAKWGTQGNEEGQFARPLSITIDSNDKVYISDTENNRIQISNTNGDYIKVINGKSCSHNNDPDTTKFCAPLASKVDVNGNLFVSDSINHQIKKYTPSSSLYDGEFSHDISNLDCGVTYQFRAYAKNEDGTSYGQNQSFTTQDCPLPPQPLDLSLSGSRLTPKPITSGNTVQYELTITNSGPGTLSGTDGASYYINIPASTEFVGLTTSEGYETECENMGDIAQLDEGNTAWVGYSGDLIMCAVYLPDDFNLPPNSSFTLTFNLLATSNLTEGQDIFRALLFTNDQTDPDMEVVYEAINSGFPVFDVPINNIISLVYGVNDEQQTNSNSDSDGVPDSVEDAAPNNGDGNNDGTPDSEQSNVTSLPIPTGSNAGTYVTLVVPAGTTLTTAAIEQATSLATKDTAYNYPLGLVSFTVSNLTPGSTIPIELYYYTNQQPNSFTPRKYNTNTNTYTTLSTVAQSQTSLTQTTINNQQALKLSYQLQDGGPLDQDNQANGTIIDPIGLAQASVGVPNTGLR